MTDESLSHSRLFLSSRDAKSLDELAQAGFNPNASWTPPSQPQDEPNKLVNLLHLLDALPGTESDPAQRDLLINITMARVLRDREDSAARIEPVAPNQAPALAQTSAAQFDNLVESDWSADSESGALTALLSAGAQSTPQQKQALIDRTLGAVQQDINTRESRFRLTAPARSEITTPSSSFSLRDLLAVAAMLLIGTAILWPLFVQSRHDIHRTATRANLAQTAHAFTSFARDHDGQMPQTASLGGKWWNVGNPEVSHSANLYRLAYDRYATLADLSCPSNPFAPIFITNDAARDWASDPEVSFSMQLYATPNPQLDDGRTRVILADRSPVIRRWINNEPIVINAPSPNHAGAGQHVLMNDGSVLWLTTPYLPGTRDNIWLPASIERHIDHAQSRITGAPLPRRSESNRDTFVGP